VLTGIRGCDPRAPVVVLTGHVSQSDSLSMASAVLTKPVTRAVLVDTISRSVQERPAAQL
jgi:hypothetical protein